VESGTGRARNSTTGALEKKKTLNVVFGYAFWFEFFFFCTDGEWRVSAGQDRSSAIGTVEKKEDFECRLLVMLFGLSSSCTAQTVSGEWVHVGPEALPQEPTKK
jgi:hypothetical protein